MRAVTVPARPALTVASYDRRDLSALTAAERRDFDALESEERQRDWLAGRCAAKRAVACATNLAARDVQLVANPGAAPSAQVRDDGARWVSAPLAVSIAHRDGWGVAAAAPFGVRIGVDIERADAVKADMKRYFVSPVEARSAEAVGAATFWTMKEAAWKTFGLGDDDTFADLQLCVGPAGDLQVARVRGIWFTAQAMVWSLPNGLIAAAVRAEQTVH